MWWLVCVRTQGYLLYEYGANHINNIVNLDVMKRFLKRLLKAYFDGANEMYGPAIRAGINPFV